MHKAESLIPEPRYLDDEIAIES